MASNHNFRLITSHAVWHLDKKKKHKINFTPSEKYLWTSKGHLELYIYAQKTDSHGNYRHIFHHWLSRLPIDDSPFNSLPVHPAFTVLVEHSFLYTVDWSFMLVRNLSDRSSQICKIWLPTSSKCSSWIEDLSMYYVWCKLKHNCI